MRNLFLIGSFFFFLGYNANGNPNNVFLTEDPFLQDTTTAFPKTIMVYVDPLASTLHISLLHSLEKKIEIVITDKNGKEMMHTHNTGGQEVTLDISSFPNGMYFIQIKTPKRDFTYKVSL